MTVVRALAPSAALAFMCALGCSESRGSATSTDASGDTDGTTSTNEPRDLGVVIAEAVSTTPVKDDEAGGWVPACEGDATHWRVNLSMTTVEAFGGEDLQVYPEDNFAGSTVGERLEASAMAAGFSCIETHQGDATAGPCTGLAYPTAAVAGEPPVTFIDHRDGTRRAGVAILIDQSGSTTGKVDGSTCLEGATESITFPTDLQECASDSRTFRLSAARNLINTLHEDDRHIAMGFNETIGVRTACGSPELNTPWDPDGLSASEDALRANCYTTDKRMTLGEVGHVEWQSALTGLGGLQGRGAGRSNLWTGVKTAVDYMSLQQLGPRNRHVVVFADGPDTCDPESPDFIAERDGVTQPACEGAVGFSEARSAVLAAQEAGEAIRVSFVHFSAPGYREADPRMQEIACLSGGQYVYVNAASLNYADGDQRGPMVRATERLRHSLNGYYGVVAEIPSMVASPGDGATAMAPGAVHALSGELTTTFFAGTDTEGALNFGWGDGEAVPAATDLRLLLHRPCLADADCDGGTCEPQTRLCLAPAAADGE